jgi:DNA-binding MarR family transcriptional regulator
MSTPEPDLPLWRQVPPDYEQRWPEADTLASLSVLNLIALAAALEARAEAWSRQCGIPSASAMQVLNILQGAGQPLPPSVIADHMLITRGALTGVVDSLERRELVRRSPHPTNRSMLLVDITPEGRRSLGCFMPLLHRGERQLVSVLSRQEQQRLLHLLAKLQHNVPDASTGSK